MSSGIETRFLQESRPTDELPLDLLSRAKARLKTLLLVAVGLSAIAMAVAVANISLEIGTARGARAGVLLHGILLALELLMLAVVSGESVPARAAIAVALVWQVAVCATISVLGTWIVVDEQQVIPRVTWTSLLIVVVPLLLPAPPKRIAVALGASALTVPLGLVSLDLAGQIQLSRADLIGSAVSPALALALAIMVGRITYGYARDLARVQWLGAYKLDERIGGGGMGEVWRGSHRLLARDAAIKFIRPDRLSKDPARALARFRDEARVIAALRSPHTVELYDFGKTESDAMYYVMELLDGLDFHTLVAKYGPQPPARVARMLEQVCRSLGEAHEAGLIHRDIKPANLFLCRLGRDVDVVKVLDFGLAGYTPGFVPPELRRGDELDGRADLWALGRVALFLLLGEHDAPIDRIDHLGLADLVARCLANDPGDRPESADELAAALRALDFDEPWTDEDAAEWWRVNQPELSERAMSAETATASEEE